MKRNVSPHNDKRIGKRKNVTSLASPLSSFLQNFSLIPQSDFVSENFTSDSDELIAHSLEKAKTEVEADDRIPQYLKNKEIVTILFHQGILKLKNAVQLISEALKISKNTVYLHIRGLEEKCRSCAFRCAYRYAVSRCASLRVALRTR